MNELIKKLISVARETALERGDYKLFALFLRENSPNKWDILVSADWISEDKGKALKYISEKIRDFFETNDYLQISGIVIIDENNPGLADLRGIPAAKEGITEIKNVNLFGLDIERAYLLVAPRPEIVQVA